MQASGCFRRCGPVAQPEPAASSGSKGGCGAGGTGSHSLWLVGLLGAWWWCRRKDAHGCWGSVLSPVALPICVVVYTTCRVRISGRNCLASETKESRLAAWVDVDLDGAADPIWITYDGVHTLGVDEAGQPTLIEVSAPDLIDPKSGPRMSVAVLDVEGDGQEELLVVGQSAQILGVSAPYTLERKPYELPVLPAVLVIDMAVGDFNGDGRVDVLLGLGIFSTERIERRGYPDMLLMNLGFGRFELTTVEPSRECYTHGLPAVDMNGDGRLDIVESCDVSYFVGPSRVLINQTAAGAAEPLFEPTQSIYDTGTFGMGAAVADIDNDGLLDIYNTNVGNDLVTRSTPSGEFEDVTFKWGFDHEFGYQAGGHQWSPTWSDLNLDRHDLVVRRGASGQARRSQVCPVSPSAGRISSTLEVPMAVHVPVPFDPDGPKQGRRAVIERRSGRPSRHRAGWPGRFGWLLAKRYAAPRSGQGADRGAPRDRAAPADRAVIEGAQRRADAQVDLGSHFGGMAASQAGFAWGLVTLRSPSR